MTSHQVNRTIVAIGLTLLFSGLSMGAFAQRAPWVGQTLDGTTCTGGDPGNFGPFDYRTDRDRLPIVENYHFTREVEQLVRGKTTQHPMGDIGYTLVRFPNHHRALYSAVRFSLGESSHSQRSVVPAECYLQRAIRFRPDDSVPFMLYGLYLHRLGKLDESLEMYQAAEQRSPDDTNMLYNIGLLYFDIGNFEASVRYAEKAYDGGIQLTGLRRKLEEAGYWP